MTISHNGFSYPGTAEEVQFGEWDRQVVYQSAFGVKGASALDGERTFRDFTVRVYMYGSFASSTAVLNKLGLADAKIGNVGTFVDSGATAKSITNVEFRALRLEEGPLPTGPDGGWMAVIVLSFRQLQPN